jgi:hypothetical protein
MTSKLVNFQCPLNLVDRVDMYKELNITNNRTESLILIIEAGLKALEPKLGELTHAARVLQDVKDGVLVQEVEETVS